jgi:hypothetical protein
MEHSMMMVMTFGLHEAKGQRRVLWLGFAQWNDLSASVRQRPALSAQHPRSHGSERELVVRLAVQYGGTAELRIWVAHGQASRLIERVAGLA